MKQKPKTPPITLQEIIGFNLYFYVVTMFLGHGLTSKVYKASSVKNNDDPKNYEIAIKNVMPEYSKEFLAEVNCLNLLDHPNIIKMVGTKFPTTNQNR